MARRKDEAWLGSPVCANCRVWARLDDAKQAPTEDVYGECRLHPPVVVDVEDGTGNPLQSLPIVQARFFCGDHLPWRN